MKIINQSSLSKLILSFFLILFFLSCNTYKLKSFNDNKAPKSPNYSESISWAVLPSKYTSSFREFASTEIDTLSADVFYVYPTLNTDKNDIRWNVPIDDIEQQEKVLNKAVLFQASAFAKAGKIYVPYYRQAHIRSFSLIESGGKDALDIAYQDVKNAFEIYLKKFHKNRPIILVGHSQGTTHLIRLLKDFFDNKPLQEKLVAAYIPGIRIKPNEFSTIKPMTKPNEIGGFVSWNTFKKGNFPKKDKNWYKGSVTTNPISWDLSKTTKIEQHKGFLFSNKKLYKNSLKIEITDGLVWSSNPKFPARFLMSFLKNYHAGDINLFWQDIRENVAIRVNTYLQKN